MIYIKRYHRYISKRLLKVIVFSEMYKDIKEYFKQDLSSVETILVLSLHCKKTINIWN